MHHLVKVALFTTAIYLLVILLMRLSGKKELAQLTIFDFVFVLLISEATQNAMLQGADDFATGLVAAVTLFILSNALDYAMFKMKKFYTVMEGTPSLLYYKGKWMEENLSKSRIRKETVLSAARKEGFDNIEAVKTIIVENDGNFSIIPL